MTRLLPLMLMLLLLPAPPASADMPRRIYHIASPQTLTDTIAVYPPLGHEPYAAIEARIAVKGTERLHSGPARSWFEIGCGGLRLRCRLNADVADNVYDRRSMVLSLFSADTLVAESSATAGLALDKGPNTYLIEWNPAADTASVYAGSSRLSLVMKAAVAAPPGSAPVALEVEGSAIATMLVAEERLPSRSERLAGLPAHLADSLLSTPSARHPFPEGVYTYLDRAANPAIARPGGRYTLLIRELPGHSGSYGIYYIAGAEVDASLWKPGMLKGTITATPFRNQYDLRWHDAHGNLVPGCEDSYATTDGDTQTLTLTFPSLDGATIRFARRLTPDIPLIQTPSLGGGRGRA